MSGFFYFRINSILTFTGTKHNCTRILDSFNSSLIKTYWMYLIILLKYLTLHVDNSKQQKWRTCDFTIMSLLRHSILRQSLLRHLLLRQSLLWLLILQQRPIVFVILVLLAIQMQYGTAHLTWKGHGFYLGVRSFYRMQRYCF
jgi:hypothetical protein